MPEIVNFRHGAILNSHHGIESENGLKVRVEGLGTYGHPVEVNGVRAEMDGRRFTAEIELQKKINEVTVSELTPFGRFSQEVTLVWDKKSFKRYGFFIDDHSFVFTDLTKQRPKSAFDHFYLKHLKHLHDKYGLKITLNCFFRNDHDPSFTLDQMPDIWKAEFQANADWLKFSFHSKSEFPDRPYIEASAEEYARDYDEVQNEIIRFAGEEAFTPPLVVHWANIHPAVAMEMIRRGTRTNSVSMRPRIMGGPSLADRMKGGDMKSVERKASRGEDRSGAPEAFRLYYEREEENTYIAHHTAYYEPNLKLFIRSGSTCCCNLVPLKDIEPMILKKLDVCEKNGCDFALLASHEQYSFPYYPNYLPDHGARLEESVRVLTERGYTCVFPNDGLLGNMSWE